MLPFLIIQRRLHWELQAVFLLLTGRVDIAMILFAIIFLPGVLLHELSHLLVARTMGVRTGNFSILPRQVGNGRLQLGYVETTQVDFLRESLIGIAPFILGCIIVAYISFVPLDLSALWDNLRGESFAKLTMIIGDITSRSDYLIWIYLVFAISSTMTPSRSDRKGWVQFLVMLIILVLLTLWIGAGPWLMTTISLPLNKIFRSFSIVVGIGLFVHFIILIPLFFLRLFLSRIRQLKVV